jgi:cell division septation protein DedD
LLIGFGFVAGLLIGVLSEEPELLAGHLRGEGESVVMAPTEGDGMADGRVISETVVEHADVERRAVMEIREDETPEVGLPVVAARSAEEPTDTEQERSWAIQVGAFEDEASAARLADGLAAKGYPAKLLAASGGSQRWRVRVQPLRDEGKARQLANRLKRVEQLPTWVLPMEGRPH